jgi:hypothetical protein
MCTSTVLGPGDTCVRSSAIDSCLPAVTVEVSFDNPRLRIVEVAGPLPLISSSRKQPSRCATPRCRQVSATLLVNSSSGYFPVFCNFG